MDDRRVVSGIIYVIKHGLQWKDAPDEYGPHKNLYNRFVRWSKLKILNKIFNKLAKYTPFDGSLMLDSTHLAAHDMGINVRLREKSAQGFNNAFSATHSGKPEMNNGYP